MFWRRAATRCSAGRWFLRRPKCRRRDRSAGVSVGDNDGSDGGAAATVVQFRVGGEVAGDGQGEIVGHDVSVLWRGRRGWKQRRRGQRRRVSSMSIGMLRLDAGRLGWDGVGVEQPLPCRDGLRRCGRPGSGCGRASPDGMPVRQLLCSSRCHMRSRKAGRMMRCQSSSGPGLGGVFGEPALAGQQRQVVRQVGVLRPAGGDGAGGAPQAVTVDPGRHGVAPVPDLAAQPRVAGAGCPWPGQPFQVRP